ncbi:12343_t:CDS:1 [Rhizophagus irregularis]|nr:12343_t:CDS:1 [Rhizophagus irregularis]
MESRARCSVHRVGDWGYAQKCKYVFMDDIVDISIFPWPEMKTYLE